MEITREDAFDSDDWEVVEDEIDGHSRWAVWHKMILKRVADGTFWMGRYDVGATEYQDGYDGDIALTRVLPMRTITTVYVTEQEFNTNL